MSAPETTDGLALRTHGANRAREMERRQVVARRAYEGGEAMLADVARAAGVSVSTVSVWARRLGWAKRGTQRLMAF